MASRPWRGAKRITALNFENLMKPTDFSQEFFFRMFMCHGNASEQKAMTKCQLQGIRETKHFKPHQNPNHPFSLLKPQTFLMSQHPWASLCVILNHTNKPIDLNGVIRSLPGLASFHRDLKSTKFPGAYTGICTEAWAPVARADSAVWGTKETRNWLSAYKRKERHQVKKKKKRSYRDRGKTSRQKKMQLKE